MHFPSRYSLGRAAGVRRRRDAEGEAWALGRGCRAPAEGTPTPHPGIEPDFKLPRAPRGAGIMNITQKEVGPPRMPGRGVRAVKTPCSLASCWIRTSLPGPSCGVFVWSLFQGFGRVGWTGLERGLQPGAGREKGGGGGGERKEMVLDG